MTDRCLSFCSLTLGAMLLLTSGKPLRAQAAAKESQPKFRVCNETYALCTRAKCVRHGDGYSCTCEVRTGPSAGGYTQACNPPVKVTPGTPLPSRYFPIKSMVVCSSPKGTEPRPWAWCLDMPCTVDKDTTTAKCECTKPPKEQRAEPFVFYPRKDSCDLSGCEEGIISSATVEDVQEVTEFLAHSSLKPFDIKVLCPAK